MKSSTNRLLPRTACSIGTLGGRRLTALRLRMQCRPRLAVLVGGFADRGGEEANLVWLRRVSPVLELRRECIHHWHSQPRFELALAVAMHGRNPTARMHVSSSARANGEIHRLAPRPDREVRLRMQPMIAMHLHSTVERLVGRAERRSSLAGHHDLPAILSGTGPAHERRSIVATDARESRVFVSSRRSPRPPDEAPHVAAPPATRVVDVVPPSRPPATRVGADELARIADHVVRALDHRALAWRERMGGH